MTTHKANGGPQAGGEKNTASTGNAASSISISSVAKPAILQAVTNTATSPVAISMTGTNAPSKGPAILAGSKTASPSQGGTTSAAAIATRFSAPNAPAASTSAAHAKTAPASTPETPKAAAASSAVKQEVTASAPIAPQTAPATKNKPQAPAATQKPAAKITATKAKASEKTAPAKAAATKPTAPQSAKIDSSSQKPAGGKVAAPVSAASAEAARVGLMQARFGYGALHEQQTFWTKGLTAGLAAATHGTAVLQGKMFDFVRSQADSTIDLWRKLLEADSMAEAVALQTSELRRQFESSSNQLKDIAQTTNRLLTEAMTSSLHTRD